MSSQTSGTDVWERLLRQTYGIDSLGPEVDVGTLACEYGTERDTAEEILHCAFDEAMLEGASQIQLNHFESAASAVDSRSNDDTSANASSSSTAAGAGKSDTDSAEKVSSDVDSSQLESSTTSECESSRSVEMDPDDHALRERVEKLEDTCQELEGLVEALRAQVKLQSQLLVGEDHVGIGVVDPENSNVDDILTRLADLDDRVTEHDQQVQMVRTDGAAGVTDPDSRARFLRQTLYNQAKENGGQAKMDRDAADSRLGGGLHRDTLLDAMRRAADGYEADINGSSDLQPVDAITFRVGRGRGSPSTLVMDLSDSTGSEIRRNLTTQITEEGG